MSASDVFGILVMVLLGLGLGLRVYLTIRKSGGGGRDARAQLTPSPSNSDWKRPQPISVHLPIATVFDTIAAEIPESSFWQHSWQHVGALGEADSEEVIARLPVDVKRSHYSAHLKAISADVEQLVELVLDMDLLAVDQYSTRINFEFVGLGGEDGDQQNAARAVVDQIESALRMKLSLIAALYQVATIGAVLIKQVDQIGHSSFEKTEPLIDQPSVSQATAIVTVPQAQMAAPTFPTAEAGLLSSNFPEKKSALCSSCKHPVDSAFSFCLHCGKAI